MRWCVRHSGRVIVMVSLMAWTLHKHLWISCVIWIIYYPRPLIVGVSSKDVAREVYVKVTTILLEPYVMKVNRSSHGNVSFSSNGHPNEHVQYEGYMIDLLDKLAFLLGFKYKITVVADGQFGFRRPDGTWNGLIGQLIRKEVDMAASPMFITDQRSQVVDFTEPFMEIQATLLMKRQQHVAIESVEDLLSQTVYDIGTRESGMISHALRTTNHTLYRNLWKRLRSKHSTSFTESNEEGIEKAREGRYVFILPSNIAEYIARKEPCDLITLDKFLLRAHFALALPKGSGLVSRLNRAMYLLNDDDFLNRLYTKWWITKNECNGIQYSKMYSLSSPSDQVRIISLLNVAATHTCMCITWYLTS